MAMMTGEKRAVREAPWSRAIFRRASASGLKSASGSRAPRRQRPERSVGAPAQRCHPLGAAGRAGAAHIMQFRPVGVEGPGEELAPEVADFGDSACMPGAVACRGRERCGVAGCHDTGPAVFRSRPLPRWKRPFWGVEGEFWPDLLKEGFNCNDLPQAWYRPRNHPW